MRSKAEVTVSGFVGWGELRSPERDLCRSLEHGLERLYLEDEMIYQLRFVGRPFRFFHHCIPIEAISPGIEHDICWQAGLRPSDRYAVLVFDRQDSNRLKYIVDDRLLFHRLAWYRPLANTKDSGPGGKVAPDWLVHTFYPSVTHNGYCTRDYGHREIVLEKLKETRLTSEEERRIARNRKALEKILAPTSPEMIARLYEEAKHVGLNGLIPGSSEWRRRRSHGLAPKPAS